MARQVCSPGLSLSKCYMTSQTFVQPRMTSQIFGQPHGDMQRDAPCSGFRFDKLCVSEKTSIGQTTAFSPTASNTAVCHEKVGYMSASTVVEKMPVAATTVAKPSRRQLQRQRKQRGMQEQHEADNTDPSANTLTEVLKSIGRKALTQAWSKANIEFKVQVLVWQSMPRRDVAGSDVLSENSFEAQAYSSIKLLLSLRPHDLSVPSESMLGAKWTTVLTHAMSQSIIDLVEARSYAAQLLRIPLEVLSTGAIAESAATNGTTREKQEIQSVVASVAKTEDAHLVRTTVLFLPSGRHKNESCSENLPRPTCIDSSPSLCENSNLRNSVQQHKVKVKNTFIEVDSSDSDESEFYSSYSRSCSSVRCHSAPPSRCTSHTSRCSSYQGSEQGSDVEDFARH